MNGPPDGAAAQLLASQRTYYDLRAPDYADASKEPDRNLHGLMAQHTITAIVEGLGPLGDVLELACGPGGFTSELARLASSLTALDASPQMLERSRREVAVPSITYVEADLFSWVPDRHYDLVFFGFWLSHVPPAELGPFWDLVRACLRPGGRAV